MLSSSDNRRRGQPWIHRRSVSLANANGESFVNSDNRGPTGIPSLLLTLGLVALVAPSAAAFPAGDDRVEDISRFVPSFGVELTTVEVVGESAFSTGWAV